MYGLSEEDRQIQARAREFADDLIPFEEEAERSGGELPADVTAAHAKRARELGLYATNMPRDTDGGTITHHAAIRAPASTPDATLSARSMISNRRRAASTRRCPGSDHNPVGPTRSDTTRSDTTRSDPTGSSGTDCRSRGACRRRRGAGPGTRAGDSSTPESTESAEAESEAEAQPQPQPNFSRSLSLGFSNRGRGSRGVPPEPAGDEHAAQMTTIATYRIALLNNPPLAEPGHGHSAEKGHGTKRAQCQKHSVNGRSVAGTVLPSSVPT